MAEHPAMPPVVVVRTGCPAVDVTQSLLSNFEALDLTLYEKQVVSYHTAPNYSGPLSYRTAMQLDMMPSACHGHGTGWKCTWRPSRIGNHLLPSSL